MPGRLTGLISNGLGLNRMPRKTGKFIEPTLEFYTQVAKNHNVDVVQLLETQQDDIPHIWVNGQLKSTKFYVAAQKLRREEEFAKQARKSQDTVSLNRPTTAKTESNASGSNVVGPDGLKTNSRQSLPEPSLDGTAKLRAAQQKLQALDLTNKKLPETPVETPRIEPTVIQFSKQEPINKSDLIPEQLKRIEDLEKKQVPVTYVRYHHQNNKTKVTSSTSPLPPAQGKWGVKKAPTLQERIAKSQKKEVTLDDIVGKGSQSVAQSQASDERLKLLILDYKRRGLDDVAAAYKHQLDERIKKAESVKSSKASSQLSSSSKKKFTEADHEDWKGELHQQFSQPGPSLPKPPQPLRKLPGGQPAKSLSEIQEVTTTSNVAPEHPAYPPKPPVPQLSLAQVLGKGANSSSASLINPNSRYAQYRRGKDTVVPIREAEMARVGITRGADSAGAFGNVNSAQYGKGVSRHRSYRLNDAHEMEISPQYSKPKSSASSASSKYSGDLRGTSAENLPSSNTSSENIQTPQQRMGRSHFSPSSYDLGQPLQKPLPLPPEFAYLGNQERYTNDDIRQAFKRSKRYMDKSDSAADRHEPYHSALLTEMASRNIDHRPLSPATSVVSLDPISPSLYISRYPELLTKEYRRTLSGGFRENQEGNNIYGRAMDKRGILRPMTPISSETRISMDSVPSQGERDLSPPPPKGHRRNKPSQDSAFSAWSGRFSIGKALPFPIGQIKKDQGPVIKPHLPNFSTETASEKKNGFRFSDYMTSDGRAKRRTGRETENGRKIMATSGSRASLGQLDAAVKGTNASVTEVPMAKKPRGERVLDTVMGLVNPDYKPRQPQTRRQEIAANRAEAIRRSNHNKRQPYI